MPKEVIRGCEEPYRGKPAVAVAEVRWGSESEHVQLVTRCVEQSSGEVFRLSGLPDPDDEGEHAEKARSAFRESFAMCAGFYVDLDRRGINDMIRHLRRARDQAFGRDE